MYLYVRRKFFGMSFGVSLTPIVCSLFFEENMEKSKKTSFTFYRNDNHMSPIVKLNRAMFHTGEPIE